MVRGRGYRRLPCQRFLCIAMAILRFLACRLRPPNKSLWKLAVAGWLHFKGRCSWQKELRDVESMNSWDGGLTIEGRVSG